MTPKFRVKILPSSDGYLTDMISYTQDDLYLSSKSPNQDFSDLVGPEFIQVFDRERYNNLQKKFPSYLPLFDSMDHRFEFIKKDYK